MFFLNFLAILVLFYIILIIFFLINLFISLIRFFILLDFNLKIIFIYKIVLNFIFFPNIHYVVLIIY